MADFATAEVLSLEQAEALAQFQLGRNVFVTGPGGTGKTKLIEHMVELAKSQNKVVQVCALTGCAAALLPACCEARTLHSWSGIKLAKGPASKVVASVVNSRTASPTWRKTKVLIVDEVSMMSCKIFDILDDIGRACRKMPLVPFGGLQVVFLGDFYQLPPIVDDGEEAQFAFESRRFKTTFPVMVHLSTIFRQTDPVYKSILMQIRVGRLTSESARILQSRVGRTFDAAAHHGVVPTKLFPTRIKTDMLNKTMYDRLEGEEERIYQCDRKTNCTTHLENNKAISAEQLAKCEALSAEERDAELQTLVGAPRIKLKKGCMVMCTVNFPLKGICNGSQGVVVGFDAGAGGFPVVRFSTGTTMTMELHYKQHDDYPTLAVGSVPLMLAWALTIHKIQGATLAMAEIDVGGHIFECGQTYVALSRVQSLEGLFLTAFKPERIFVHEKVRQFYDALSSS
jgi:ATP-dependent DNA helicase PIF1